MIPLRCVHCAAILPGAWHATQQLWGACADCAAWQVWLWAQVPPVLVEDADFEVALAEALEEWDVG